MDYEHKVFRAEPDRCIAPTTLRYIKRHPKLYRYVHDLAARQFIRHKLEETLQQERLKDKATLILSNKQIDQIITEHSKPWRQSTYDKLRELRDKFDWQPEEKRWLILTPSADGTIVFDLLTTPSLE